MNALLILTLLNIPGIKRKHIIKLLKIKMIKSLEVMEILDFFQKGYSTIKNITVPSIIEIETAMKQAEAILKASYDKGIKCITILDSKFPEHLKRIKEPPIILFYIGNKECLFDRKNIAIIGTRNPTNHGVKISKRLGELFGQDGFIVTSGLAKGCDEFAHLGCVEALGRSIAVLPCGLDRIYPISNKQLALKIIQNNGCLVSEYPIGTKPIKRNFIDRNRLQSALSVAVIVVETQMSGGTMHTVQFALEQKRILACYKHAEKFNTSIQTYGNQYLIDKNLALPLANSKDIINLKNIVNKEL